MKSHSDRKCIQQLWQSLTSRLVILLLRFPDHISGERVIDFFRSLTDPLRFFL